MAEADRVTVQRRTGEAVRAALDTPAVRTMWEAFWTSRLVVFVTGILGVLAFGLSPGWQAYDTHRFTYPFGYFANLLVAPFARWDSAWYLLIAQHGYAHDPARAEFFPLYPLTTRLVGVVFVSNLIGGIVISLVSFAIALVVLYRLVELELDGDAARITVMLIAFCPMALFFSAVYSESLFLLLSVGCFFQARRGKWGSAGILGALAAFERNTGIMLAVPIVLLFLYGPRGDRAPVSIPHGASRLRRLVPRYKPAPELAWVLLVPAGLVAYFLALSTIPGLTWTSAFAAKKYWFHYFAGPYGGVWHGIVAAWDGLRQLAHGPPPPIYFTPAIRFGDPLTIAGENLVLFAFLVLGAIAIVGAFRRLPFAYGAYSLAALAIPLSYPVTWQPLGGLDRYEVVLFPLFMWGALWVRRRGWTTPAIASLAVLLGLFSAEFATWRWIA